MECPWEGNCPLVEVVELVWQGPRRSVALSEARSSRLTAVVGPDGRVDVEVHAGERCARASKPGPCQVLLMRICGT